MHVVDDSTPSNQTPKAPHHHVFTFRDIEHNYIRLPLDCMLTCSTRSQNSVQKMANGCEFRLAMAVDRQRTDVTKLIYSIVEDQGTRRMMQAKVGSGR